MKVIPIGLAADYAQEVTTLTTCWKATLTNGTVIAATALDINLTVDGLTYQSTAGYTASDNSSSSELNPDNMELVGFLQSPAITDDDIRSGVWDYAKIEIFEVNYLDTTRGKNILRSGTLGEVKAGRSKFTAELRGLQQAYTRNTGRSYKKTCDTTLGSDRCKVNLTPFTVTGTVATCTGNRIITDSARTEAADYFAAGKITFTSGLNNGLSMEVKGSASGTFALHQPMPFPIAPGDTYSMHAGCMKRFAEDCKGKFNNGINHQGFPHLRGSDVYQYGGEFN